MTYAICCWTCKQPPLSQQCPDIGLALWAVERLGTVPGYGILIRFAPITGNAADHPIALILQPDFAPGDDMI